MHQLFQASSFSTLQNRNSIMVMVMLHWLMALLLFGQGAMLPRKRACVGGWLGQDNATVAGMLDAS